MGGLDEASFPSRTPDLCTCNGHKYCLLWLVSYKKSCRRLIFGCHQVKTTQQRMTGKGKSSRTWRMLGPGPGENLDVFRHGCLLASILI